MSTTPTEPTAGIQEGDRIALDMPGGVTYEGTAHLTETPGVIRVVLDDGFEGLWEEERLRKL